MYLKDNYLCSVKTLWNMEQMRLYTAGTADFERIRQDGRIYVDKTDLIYKLSHESQFVFLSRPRRFGKSLLCSTLKYYFQGRKDLFEGLAIADLEKEWKQYPVLHFDISACKNKETTEEIKESISLMLDEYERIYGSRKPGMTLGMRFADLIYRARRQSGLRVAVIIDDFDAPLIDFKDRPDDFVEVSRIMREFYQMMKASDADVQFVFVTGLTDLYYDVTVNNFTRISTADRYDSICGVTKDELMAVFKDEIQDLATAQRCTPDELVGMLDLHYGGYQFGRKPKVVFNPYCLMKAFESKRLDDYWFSEEMVTNLYKQLELTDSLWIGIEEPMRAGSYDFYKPEEENSSFSMLYETGIIGIKDYDFISDRFHVGFPNQEARKVYQQLLSIRR